MNSGCGTQRFFPQFELLSRHFLDKLRMTTRKLNRNDLSPGRNLYLQRPETISGLLTTWSQRLLTEYLKKLNVYQLFTE
jgi:hypothetical protein